ncbi:hypothetical protein NB311A_17449 [Nitrobacter sp. Nb-311A]|nr:hypothetical protein NB311A_17449 [Nitrobacter sp. Nb-311A]
MVQPRDWASVGSCDGTGVSAVVIREKMSLAGVGQTSELMQSYNNVARLGHFRGASIRREQQMIAGSSLRR